MGNNKKIKIKRLSEKEKSVEEKIYDVLFGQSFCDFYKGDF